MPKIRYNEEGGASRDVEAVEGASVMETAVANLVKGIDGDCGGCCACGTCHVHVAAEWRDRLHPMGDEEKAMLEFADGLDAGSRLSCQIRMTSKLDGLVVDVPAPQR